MISVEVDLKERFEKIYSDDKWTFGSGPGSIESINRPYIKLLESFIQDNSIGKIIDIGCGDFQFMCKVDIGNASYLGFDVATSIIAKNKSKFESDQLQFCEMPYDFNQIPKCDLVMIKDVMIHLDNKYCLALIESLRNKAKYAIFVNDYTEKIESYNCDIEPGDFRPVDVSLPPFNLPSAVLLRYSAQSVPDPRYPQFVSRLLRKYIWPGRKHVQLASFN